MDVPVRTCSHAQAGRPRTAPRLATCLLLALVASCLPGCATFRRHSVSSDSVGACRQLTREGVAASEHGDSARARLLLEQAVAASPTDVDARRQLAEVLWREGAGAEAVEHIETAVELDPRDAPSMVRSGEMLLGIRAVEDAHKRAEEALVLDPTLASAWALRGRVFRQRGEQERALADFHQALRYNTQAMDVLLEAAQLQYELGRPQRCLTTLESLLEMYSAGQEPRAVLWLEGLALTAVDRPHDAVNALYAASLRGAPDAELFYQLAQAQNAVGDVAAAAISAQQAADAGHEGGKTLMARLQAAGGETILR